MTEWAVEIGDVVSVLREYNDNAFDAVLCDPPYGLSFMGKRWDYDVPSAELWREVLRVCKPGAPLIAFSGTRTYHRTVVQIEDAGWEVRDQIAWLYGSGFPKSLDVSKAIDKEAGHWRGRAGAVLSDNPAMSGGNYERTPKGDPVTAAATWDGYGTALKPAFEPAVLARKPLEGTVAANVAKWGVGALAIDACRIEFTDAVNLNARQRQQTADGTIAFSKGMVGTDIATYKEGGRWPANVILDEAAGAVLDAQAAATSRFFYCAKAARKERDMGCADLPALSGGEVTDREDGSAGVNNPRAGAGRTGGARNHHPTVKPIALTEYLARLLLPPNPGAILVPFAGSGSEMIGAVRAGWPCVVGIEREPAYVEIARRRVAAA